MVVERTPHGTTAVGEAAQALRTAATARKLGGLTDALASGSLTQRSWAAQMRSEIRASTVTSYIAGLSATGRDVSSVANLTAVERRELQSEVDRQLDYFRSFAADVSAKDQATGADVQRAKMYGGANDGVFNHAKLTAFDEADKTATVYWRLRAAEHCEDCEQLADGSPYSMNELDQVPGDGQTECGTNCKCFLDIRAVR